MNNKQFLLVLAVIYLSIFSVYYAFAAGVSVGKAKTQWGSIELFSDKCVAKKVLKQLDPAAHANYKRAVVIYGGTNLASCYRVVPERIAKQLQMADEMYFIIDESGDAGFMSKEEFKRGLGT